MRRFTIGDKFLFAADGGLLVVRGTWGRGRNCGVTYDGYAAGVLTRERTASERTLAAVLKRMGAVHVDGPHCRVCGCTEGDCRHCIARTGAPCSWAAADLCSACIAPPTTGRPA